MNLKNRTKQGVEQIFFPGCRHSRGWRIRSSGACQVPQEARSHLRSQMSEEAAHCRDSTTGTRLQREEHPDVMQTYFHHKVSSSRT